MGLKSNIAENFKPKTCVGRRPTAPGFLRVKSLFSSLHSHVSSSPATDESLPNFKNTFFKSLKVGISPRDGDVHSAGRPRDGDSNIST